MVREVEGVLQPAVDRPLQAEDVEHEQGQAGDGEQEEGDEGRREPVACEKSSHGRPPLLHQAALPFEPVFEKRYPYLDRDLLEFMYAIPREQLVRPTQRRSLMRRALAGIVPDEILNRKTKAFVSRASFVAVQRDWATFVEMTQNMVMATLGIVDPQRISEALQTARSGKEVPMNALTRSIFIEGWLRDIYKLGVLNLDGVGRPELVWQGSTQGQ